MVPCVSVQCVWFVEPLVDCHTAGLFMSEQCLTNHSPHDVLLGRKAVLLLSTAIVSSADVMDNCIMYVWPFTDTQLYWNICLIHTISIVLGKSTLSDLCMYMAVLY